MKRNACWLSHGLCRPFVTSAAMVLNSRVNVTLFVAVDPFDPENYALITRGYETKTEISNFRRHVHVGEGGRGGGDSSASKNMSVRRRASP